MKTNTVTTDNPFVMAEWVPLKDRVELSLIFMVAASAGKVVLASRGLEAIGYIAVSVTGILMFSMLWILPIVSLRSVLRAVAIGLIWTGFFTAIEHQVKNVMTNPVSYQEVSGR